MEATEYEIKSRAFMAKVEGAMAEVFEVEDRPVVVIGLQFGDMGAEGTNLPPCVLSSNLPICMVGSAIHDMHDEAVEQHNAFHASDEDGFMATDLADAPEEVQEYARSLAESLGVPIESVQVQQFVDTADLADDDLPDWLKGTDIAEAMTGGDIAAAGLGLSDEDIADIRKGATEAAESDLDGFPEQEV
jgi:hypothetical protein